MTWSAGAFPADAESRWRERRETEHRLISTIHNWAMTSFGPAMAAFGWHMFATGDCTDKSWGKSWPLFSAWFAFGFKPRHPELDLEFSEVAGTDVRSWPTTSLAEYWAANVADQDNKDDRAFAVLASRSPWSLLLVREVEPGRGLELRDLLTGRTFSVFEPELSLHTEPDQVLVSAVLTMDGWSTLMGVAPYALTGEWRVEARQIREADSDEPWLSREALSESSSEVFTAFREACEDRDNDGSYERAPIRFCAHRPSEFAPVLLRWQVPDDVPAVMDALRPIVMYDDCVEIDLELGPEGTPRAEGYWCAPHPTEPEEWETLGYLHVEEGAMSAEVPTARRADELEGEVARLLPRATLIERRPAGVVVKLGES